jgi:Sulfotransferase family
MILSVHMPKTAGTTFRQILIELYGTAIFFDYLDQYDFVDPEAPSFIARVGRGIRGARFKQLRRLPKASDQCIHGHFRASKYLSQYTDVHLITWLRDPVERVASHYYHWLRHPDPYHSLSRKLHAQNLSLEAFAELEPMQNLQFRYLDNVPIERFGFVGVQEHFEEMLPRFFAFLEVTSVEVKTKNVNQEKALHKRYDMSPETRAHIEALNQKDRAMYTYALHQHKQYS